MKVPGKQQQELFAADCAFHRHALEFPAPRRDVMAARDRLHRHETDVVTVGDIVLAGIAEADEKQHGVTGFAALSTEIRTG